MDWSTLASVSWMCHQIEASFKSKDYKIPVDCIEEAGEPPYLCILTTLHFGQQCQDVTESLKTPLGAVAFVVFDVLFYACTRSSQWENVIVCVFTKPKLRIVINYLSDKNDSIFIQISIVVRASVLSSLMRNAKCIFECLFTWFLFSGFLVGRVSCNFSQ